MVKKHPPATAREARDMGSIPGSGRSSGVGNGNPLQYSCQENCMDRGAWWVTVHGVAKMQTQLSTHTHTQSHTHTHPHTHTLTHTHTLVISVLDQRKLAFDLQE